MICTAPLPSLGFRAGTGVHPMTDKHMRVRRCCDLVRRETECAIL
jgi:hypothetical protein